MFRRYGRRGKWPPRQRFPHPDVRRLSRDVAFLPRLSFSACPGRGSGVAATTHSAPAGSGSGSDLHPARGRDAVREAGAALFDRQGFERARPSRAQGVLSDEAAVPAAARRYAVEIPGDDRVPRRDRAATRARAHRRRPRGRRGPQHQPDRFRLRAAHPHHEDRGAQSRARPLRLRRGDRRSAARRGGQPRQGARPLGARARAFLGSAPAAAGAVEPVERLSRARGDHAGFPAVELDRARRVGLHPRREHCGGAVVFRRAAPGRAPRGLFLRDAIAATARAEKAGFAPARDLLRFLACGSVDDGKSTLIGRLLPEAGAVPLDRIEALEQWSRKFGSAGEKLDYALLLDGLEAEREQGITIDVAYRYFSTPRRAFLVADTPGHEQYTRNMATGASHAEAALVLVDARNGIDRKSV